MEQQTTNPENSSESRMLFKGLSPNSFSIYFQNEGITPKYPNRPWITDDWQLALDNAGLLHEDASFVIAVIDSSIMQRGNLRNIPYSGFQHHFVGNEKIEWDAVSSFIANRKGMEEIKKIHEELKPAIPWEEFAAKFVLIDTKEQLAAKRKELQA